MRKTSLASSFHWVIDLTSNSLLSKKKRTQLFFGFLNSMISSTRVVFLLIKLLKIVNCY